MTRVLLEEVSDGGLFVDPAEVAAVGGGQFICTSYVVLRGSGRRFEVHGTPTEVMAKLGIQPANPHQVQTAGD